VRWRSRGSCRRGDSSTMFQCALKLAMHATTRPILSLNKRKLIFMLSMRVVGLSGGVE